MRDYLQISLRSIMSNKLRSGMTLLGVVIGVWAITSMQGVVEGFDRAIEKELSALGSESFVVSKFPPMMVGGHDFMEYVRRKDLTFVKFQVYWKAISFCQYFGLVPFQFA